jgi:hypothetical protein
MLSSELVLQAKVCLCPVENIKRAHVILVLACLRCVACISDDAVVWRAVVSICVARGSHARAGTTCADADNLLHDTRTRAHTPQLGAEQGLVGLLPIRGRLSVLHEWLYLLPKGNHLPGQGGWVRRRDDVRGS